MPMTLAWNFLNHTSNVTISDFCCSFEREMSERKQRVLGVQREAPVTSTKFGNENSRYKVGDDISILLDEVLNNSVRSILIFDQFSGQFSDMEVYSLSVVFKYNFSVLALTISGCDIGDEAVSMLCEALVHTNVQYIDFTSTPLDDEAGRSLAGLAHCNQNLRTVVIDDTLISEELMDEVDVCCQFNESNNPNPQVTPIDPNRTRYCVAHFCGGCPNGDYCLLSHAPINSRGGVRAEANWRKELPPDPEEGASWMPEGEEKPRLKFTFQKRPRMEQPQVPEQETQEGASSIAASTRNGPKNQWVGYATGAALLTTGIVLVALLLSKRRR